MEVLIALMGIMGFGLSGHAVETCTIDNFREFIFDAEKTDNLIENTNEGCNLQGAHLYNQDIGNAYLKKADLSSAYLVKSVSTMPTSMMPTL